METDIYDRKGWRQVGPNKVNMLSIGLDVQPMTRSDVAIAGVNHNLGILMKNNVEKDLNRGRLERTMLVLTGGLLSSVDIPQKQNMIEKFIEIRNNYSCGLYNFNPTELQNALTEWQKEYFPQTFN